MTSSTDRTHTPLLNNPWFYGGLVLVVFFMVLVAAGSPRIKDPWFWQSNERSSVAKGTITRGKLLKQLEKHPESKAVGRPNAPVTMTEYTDFQCSECRDYAIGTFPHLLRNFVQTGKVYYRVRHFSLEEKHEVAWPVAIAAECAAKQNAFWQFKKLIMDNQSRINTDLLRQFGHELNLDQPKRYTQCLKNRETNNEVRSDRDSGLSRDVKSVPTFLINDRLVRGAKSYRIFSRIIGIERRNVPNP